MKNREHRDHLDIPQTGYKKNINRKRIFSYPHLCNLAQFLKINVCIETTKVDIVLSIINKISQ